MIVPGTVLLVASSRLCTKYIQLARMPASRRISQRQLEVLLDFAEANKDIALGRCTRGPQASQLTQRAWETVAIKLNSVADGVTKTAEQWRRYWVEWKAKTKAKGADVRRNARKTGGGPNKLTPLNVLEERILQLIGRVCVEGLPGVRMPFPIPSETMSIPPSQPSTSQTTDSTSQASPSSSQMEVQWLEDEDYHLEISSSHQQLPQPSPVPLTSQTDRPSPIPTPLPPPQSSPPHPSPPHQLQTPSPQQRQSPPAQPAQSSPRRRSRQRLMRNRDVPQWARSLEERRIAIEEMHARALGALSATLERRLANIEDRLSEICNKLGNNT